MGIHNLNYLFVNSLDYSTRIKENNKIKTVIVDGSNLVITYLSAVVSGLVRDEPEQQLLQRYKQIIEETTYSISNVLKTYKHIYKDAELIVIFDSTSNPDYRIRQGKEFRIIKAKELESKTRAARRNNDSKLKSIIERMKLDGKTDEEIECYLQWTYLNRPDNYFKLVKDVTNYLVHTTEFPVTFLSGVSETDFVIRSLAFTRADEDNEVLVLSVDTDYLVLLSDVEHAYLKKIQLTEKKIMYPYEIWKETLGVELTFEQIVKLAIIFGCDYNEHSGLIILDAKDVNKNINNTNALLKSFDESSAHFGSTRLKKIKDALKKVGININKRNDMNDEQLVSTLDLLVDDNFKEIYEIYCNWEYNTDFVRYNHQRPTNGLVGGGSQQNYFKELMINFAKNYTTETCNKLYSSELTVVVNVDEYIDEIISENNKMEEVCLLDDE